MSDFPTLSDVEQYLQQSGLLVGSLPTALAGVADAAVDHWLVDTGYHYWLPTSTVLTLPVRQGLIVPPAGIIDLTAVTINGSLLDSEQYRLEPSAPRGPAQYLRIYSHYSGEAEVDATYGWSDVSGFEVPDDVWLAVLLKACQLAAYSLANAAAGPLVAVQQGDVRYQFAADGAVSRIEAWRNYWQQTVSRYRRLGVV